ncbi:MAG: hypothetical protein ACRDCA_17640 [Serratia sp. (in: enterobacteria)]|uniref:hypothetical protein n=1 Tax=Serratia sp. (in: enterobacteria) TaxID=616 RepID=UPI003F4045D9
MQFLALSKKAVPLAMLLALSLPAAWAAQNAPAPIPPALIGNWSVTKIIPTQTVGCWDEKQAQQLVGNSINYKADGFTWHEQQVINQGAITTTVEAQEFVEDNSGDNSYVDFPTLGISTPSVQRVIIQHQDVSVPGITDQGSEGVPGDNVLVKDRNTLIFSQCGVWFEAQRQKK